MECNTSQTNHIKDGIVTNSPLHSKVPGRRMGQPVFLLTYHNITFQCARDVEWVQPGLSLTSCQGRRMGTTWTSIPYHAVSSSYED